MNVSIGHSHPKVVQAIKDQAEKLATIGPPMASESRSRLGKLLAEVTPGDLSMSFFTNGGAEANENAIKLARWYTGRHKIVARYRSYHGATGGAITLTGDPRRWAAEPGLPGVVRMLDPYTYRCPAGHPDPCPVCTGAPHLEEILQYEGAHTVAAVILETITGTNGVIVPPDGYLQSIRETCDRHGILLICDEVMAGFGRTGKWFAVDNWDVVPDIMTVAKGINSGYVPLGAMIVREPIADWVRDKLFAGGLTYSGHPLACASAVASIEAFQEEGIVEQAAANGEVFRTELQKLAEKHPSVGEVRGLGCFWGIELVKSRETREPLVPFNAGGDAAKPIGAVAKRALDRGLYLDDALERRHVLPAVDDHPRRARRGARGARRGALGRRRVRRVAGRARVALPDELRELAESPDRFSEIPAEGLVTRYDDGRVCIVQGPTFASVCAPSVGDGEVGQLLRDVRAIAPVAKRPCWWIGPSARPAGIVEELEGLGLAEPLDRVPRVHALATASKPEGLGPEIEARMVETFEDFTASAELRFDVFDVPAERREAERGQLRRLLRGVAAGRHPRLVRRVPRGEDCRHGRRDSLVARGVPDRRSDGDVGARTRRLPRPRARAVGLRDRPRDTRSGHARPGRLVVSDPPAHRVRARLRDPPPRRPRLRPATAGGPRRPRRGRGTPRRRRGRTASPTRHAAGGPLRLRSCARGRADR